jgi:hypothetical protein
MLPRRFGRPVRQIALVTRRGEQMAAVHLHIGGEVRLFPLDGVQHRQHGDGRLRHGERLSEPGLLM